MQRLANTLAFERRCIRSSLRLRKLRRYVSRYAFDLRGLAGRGASSRLRRLASGVWYILQSSDGYDQAKYKEYAWGNATDNVVAGDFDGDGRRISRSTVPRSGIWYILQSSDGYDPNLYKAYLWGNATDSEKRGQPMMADLL